MARRESTAISRGGTFRILKVPFPYPKPAARRFIQRGGKRITKKI